MYNFNYQRRGMHRSPQRRRAFNPAGRRGGHGPLGKEFENNLRRGLNQGFAAMFPGRWPSGSSARPAQRTSARPSRRSGGYGPLGRKFERNLERGLHQGFAAMGRPLRGNSSVIKQPKFSFTEHVQRMNLHRMRNKPSYWDQFNK